MWRQAASSTLRNKGVWGGSEHLRLGDHFKVQRNMAHGSGPNSRTEQKEKRRKRRGVSLTSELSRLTLQFQNQYRRSFWPTHCGGAWARLGAWAPSLVCGGFARRTNIYTFLNFAPYKVVFVGPVQAQRSARGCCTRRRDSRPPDAASANKARRPVTLPTSHR
jgi:hypothetical protein